jgi:hypothetical protein
MQDALRVGALVDDVEVQAVRGVSYSYVDPEPRPALKDASFFWRSSPVVALLTVPSAATKSTWLMSSGCESTTHTKQLKVPQEELAFLVLEIRTPWPGSKESEPICWTTSIV